MEIKTFPPFPKGLSVADVDFSESKFLADNEEALRIIVGFYSRHRNKGDFRIIIPDGLKAIPSIIEAYQAKYELDQAKKAVLSELSDRADRIADEGTDFPTLQLFHRLSAKSVETASELERSIILLGTIAKKIKMHPEVLGVIDEISSKYLTPTVNDPSAGLNQIANFVEAYVQPDIQLKLESARVILAISFIREEAAKLFKPESGSSTKVDFVNYVLEAVHSRLFDEKAITRHWPGVLTGETAYPNLDFPGIKKEEMRQIIDQVSSLVKEQILDLPIDKVAESICDGPMKSLWAGIIIKEDEVQELAEIKQVIGLLKEKLSQQPKSENAREINSALSNLENSYSESLLRASKEKTLEGLKSEQERSSPPGPGTTLQARQTAQLSSAHQSDLGKG